MCVTRYKVMVWDEDMRLFRHHSTQEFGDHLSVSDCRELVLQSDPELPGYYVMEGVRATQLVAIR